MNRRGFLAAGASALAALSGCFGSSNRELPDEPTGSWRQYASDAENTGASDVAVPARGNRAWDAGVAGVAAPVVDDGTVYSVADEAVALDAKGGEEDWRSDLPEEAEHTPALDDERLIVAAGNRLVTLDRESGDELWSEQLSRPVDGAPTLVTDPPRLTVPIGEFGLMAYDPTSGDRLWEDTTIAPRTAAVSDGTLFITGYRQDGNTGVLRGIDAADGTRLWDVDLDSPDAPPVVADDELVVADGGTLAVHDPADGTRRRTLGSFGDRIPATPAVADEMAYFGSYGWDFAAVSLADGSTEWRVDASVVGDAAVSVGRDAVVASLESLPEESAAGVAAFERESGDVRWEYGIEGFDAYPSTAPVLAEDAVYHANNASSGVVALGDLPPRDED